MAILGISLLSSPWPAVIAAIGLALGFLLRRLIVRGIQYYSRIVSFGLVIYAVVLFVGNQVGLNPEVRLMIITVTTVVIFDLWFWSLSDPSVSGSRNPACIRPDLDHTSQ